MMEKVSILMDAAEPVVKTLHPVVEQLDTVCPDGMVWEDIVTSSVNLQGTRRKQPDKAQSRKSLQKQGLELSSKCVSLREDK